jgi:hypothetical protein
MPDLTLTLAQMAEDCYYSPPGWRGVPAFCGALRKDWTAISIPCAKNAFSATAYIHNRIRWVVVAFRGTNNFDDKVADIGGIGFGLNNVLLHTSEALQFTRSFQGQFKDLWLTGHSLGGAYVQLVAATLNSSGKGSIPGMTFNAPGVLNIVNMNSGNFRWLIGFEGATVFDRLGYGIPDLANIVFAADSAYPPVLNYRAKGDLVSLVGVPVGSPQQTLEIKLHPNEFPPNHGIKWIVEYLSGRTRKK